MSDGQFIKLFRYVEEFRSEINQKFDEKASAEDMRLVRNQLDSLAKQ
jgi:hypothetical protein